MYCQESEVGFGFPSSLVWLVEGLVNMMTDYKCSNNLQFRKSCKIQMLTKLGCNKMTSLTCLVNCDLGNGMWSMMAVLNLFIVPGK